MENQNSKYCPKCGEVVMPTAAFCQACGKQLQPNDNNLISKSYETEFQHEHLVAPNRDFKKIRLMNWVIVVLACSAAVPMLIKATSFTNILLIATLLIFILSSFLLTALVLSRETLFFAGFPIAPHRNKLKKTAITCNIILGIFGIMGLIACLATGQIGPIVSMLVYIIPPLLNIQALRIPAPSK